MKFTPASFSSWCDTDALLDALISLGDEQKDDLLPYVEQLLAHGDPDVREEAARKVFVHWRVSGQRSRAIQMALRDPADDVRTTAVFGIAALSGPGTISEDTQVLIRLLRDTDEDAELRRAAYESLLLIHGTRPIPPVNRSLDFERDVDWQWISALEKLHRDPNL